jgi:hypothetical protein
MPYFLLLIVTMSIINCSTVSAADKEDLLINEFKPLTNSDMRVFRLSAGDIKSAQVRWGPSVRWTLERNEINSLIRILRKARKENIKPFNGPFPKGGPFQVTLLTTSNEHFTLTTGGGGGYIICPGGKVYLPEFSEFMKPFIIRRANEAIMDKSI